LTGKRVLVVEEVVRHGSLASLIMDAIMVNHMDIELESYAIDDIYVDSGTTDELRKDLGIDVDSIINKI
jgi:deoxyxylulose-5-phosphate synthase